MMKEKLYVVAVIVFLVGVLTGWHAAKNERLVVGWPAVDGYRERVELVTYRTQNPHSACPSNGFWQVSGQPRKIEAYGIDKAVWPHKCSGCSATNEIYDATWPRFEREWRKVK